jgi:hypothetical protein
MTSTRTHTSTKTYTRVALIKEQVRRLLRRTVKLSSEALSKIGMGIDNRWIRKVTIYAMNNENLCRGELIFEIDWEEYDFQVSKGKASVTIDGRWVDDTAIEVDEIINLFNDFVTTYSLLTKCSYTYSQEIINDESEHVRIREILGHVPFEGVKWAKDKHGIVHQIPELPEVTVGCFLVEDEE